MWGGCPPLPVLLPWQNEAQLDRASWRTSREMGCGRIEGSPLRLAPQRSQRLETHPLVHLWPRRLCSLTRKQRTRSQSFSLGSDAVATAERAESFGVLKAVQQHARLHHAFAGSSSLLESLCTSRSGSGSDPRRT